MLGNNTSFKLKELNPPFDSEASQVLRRRLVKPESTSQHPCLHAYPEVKPESKENQEANLT